MPTCARWIRASGKFPPRTAKRGTSLAPHPWGWESACWRTAVGASRATDRLTADGIESAAALALGIARAGTLARTHEVTLAPEEKYQAVWTSPMRVDPFTVPVDRSLAVLLAVDKELRHNAGVSLAEAAMQFEKRRQVFVSTLGSAIDQTRCLSGAGFSALCYKDGEIQKRSFPNSFGGQFQLKGYELVDELRLVENAPRIAEEAVALHAAEQCPEGESDLILDSAQLGLQIHESIGHPIELDRVLGSEANYAGMSFLTLDQLNHLRYVVGEVMATDPDEPADIEAEEVTFGLERDLQSALRANISQLEQGLTISDDGKERVTEAGRIDITAKDGAGKLVVIELKAGTASPDVIAQVLAYMGAIAESDGGDVRGIIVAGDFHKRVILAARVIPTLALRQYSFQFKFEMVK
jgi:hypothetical protein